MLFKSSSDTTSVSLFDPLASAPTSSHLQIDISTTSCRYAFIKTMKLKRILKWSARAILLALILAFLVGFIAYWRSTNECDRNTGAPANPMKAILHCEYGGPEVLTLVDVEKPTPADNQVLVRVRAASVNPLDLTIRGPWLLRPLFGMRKPKDTRLGVDYAGTVEAVGKNVTKFKPGDEVFGGKTAPSPNTFVFWRIEQSC